MHCPPPSVATCNPPPAMYVACPPDLKAGFTIISFDGKGCFLDDGKTSTACPSYDRPTPPDAAMR